MNGLDYLKHFAAGVAMLCSAAVLEAAPATLGAMPIVAEGYAVQGGSFFFWGDGAYRWDLAQATPVKIAGGRFIEGGALVDVNGDGRTDVVLVDASAGVPALVWLEAPAWTRHVIDTGVDAADMIPATLFGRRGVLLIHKRMQVRFYEIPDHPAERWPETEVYSFYTPSNEGGLALADVNGDGRVDILAGDYFLESPAAFELPWHAWAIDTWTEVRSSGLLRVAWLTRADGVAVRVAIQRAMAPGRFAWFERPDDFKKLWTAHAITDPAALDEPRSLAMGDFRGLGRGDLVVAEHGGSGRLIFYANEAAGWLPTGMASGRHWDGVFGIPGKGVFAFDDGELLYFSQTMLPGMTPRSPHQSK